MYNKLFFLFDIPIERTSFRVKVWRELKKIEAKKEMRSYWSLPYSKENIKKLRRIGKEIIKNAGKIEIIEGKTIWKK